MTVMKTGVTNNDRKVFTTGQISKLLEIAPRTVTKFFDSGELKGYRIGCERRIPRDNLIRFLVERGIPLNGLKRSGEYHLLAVGMDTWTRDRVEAAAPVSEGFRWQWATTSFAAGLLLGGELYPNALVIDLAMGRGEGLAIARHVQGLLRYKALEIILLTCEDETADFSGAGYTAVLQRPFDVETLAEQLRALVRNTD